jgi:uncharacterized membrane protein YkoI
MIRHRANALRLASILFAASACKSTHASVPDSQPAQKPAVAAQVEAAPDDGRPKTDLLTSIATAKASVPDAKFVGAEFDTQDGKAEYVVLLIGSGTVHEVHVDSHDGHIANSAQGEFDEESQQGLDEMLQGQTVDAEQIIRAALAKVAGSWAQSAWPDKVEDQPAYCVLLSAGEADKYVYVSTRDGQVLQVLDTPLDREDEGEEGMEMQGSEAPPK